VIAALAVGVALIFCWIKWLAVRANAEGERHLRRLAEHIDRLDAFIALICRKLMACEGNDASRAK